MNEAEKWALWIGVFVLIVALRTIYKRGNRKLLLGKYGDEALVARILNKEVWQGQTQQQLRDALGSPARIDERVNASKATFTYCYQSDGKGGYRLRVTVEDGVVVGWKKR